MENNDAWLGKQRPWKPPSAEEFIDRLKEALAEDDGDAKYRLNVGLQCWTFMNRAWRRRTSAASARTRWNWLRYAGSAIPVVAAGAGGSIVGRLNGDAALTVGWVALVGGLLGSAINAIRPAVEYSVDVTKASAFEQLYWDVFNYAMSELPRAEISAISGRLNEFSQRLGDIAVTSGGSVTTAS